MKPGRDRVVPLEGEALAGGAADVRGWAVIAGDGTRIGEVDDLLVDRVAGDVRFLDVTVAQELVRDVGTTRHVLVPVGSARLEAFRDRVVVDGLTSPGLLLADERRDDDADADERPGGGAQHADSAPIVDRRRAIVDLEPPRPARQRDDASRPSRERR